jgi:YD repeat-containing protein
MPFESVVGPGGMLSTVGDWLIWNEALANKTLGAALVDSLHRRGRLTSGREINYALGLFIQQWRGVREVAHSGSTGGYSTYLTRFPDHGNLSIAVLCNSTAANPTAGARAIAERFITDVPARGSLDTTALDSTAFRGYLGLYRNTRTHAPLLVTAASAREYRTLGDGWLWASNGTSWRFEPGPRHPAGFVIAQPDGDTVRFAWAADTSWTPAAAELAQFAGSYRSDEVRATYSLEVKQDSLTLSPRAGTTLTLRPSFPDAFTTRGRTVWFTRDRRGRVTAMHVSEGRMWDLVFTRTAERVADGR